MDPIQEAAKKPIAILLSILIIVFMFLGWRSEVNQRNINVNADQLKADMYLQCLEDQKLSLSINRVLIALIQGAEVGSFEPPERAERIERYKKATIVIQNCNKS